MRRSLAAFISCALVVGLGCGNRYQVRMDRTIEELKYNREVDKALEPAPTDGRIKELDVYVRPPKPLQPAKEFLLGALQPGLFDVEKSFFEGQKSFLHVLARKKMPRKAPAKGAPAEPQATRGEFNADVLAVLKGVFGDDENIAIEKFKSDPHKGKEFRRAIFAANGKTVQVDLLKSDPYDVALIFVFDPADQTAMNAKIRYCLETFALGDKAKNKYNNMSDAEAEEATPTGVAF